MCKATKMKHFPLTRFLLEKLTVAHLLKKSPPPLWNTKDHYRVHRSPLLVLNLSQMHTAHTFLSYFHKIIVILSFHLWLGLPSGLFPSGPPTNFPCGVPPPPHYRQADMSRVALASVLGVRCIACKGKIVPVLN
jgi:hypothetical protein